MTNTHTGKTCPYCQTPVKPNVAVVECSACGIPHHIECWNQNGGCTTFGCTGRETVARPGMQPIFAAPPPLDLTGISGLEDRAPLMQSPEQVPIPRRGEPPLIAAAETLAGCGSWIGGIAGFIVGLNAGGMGCIPGALAGFFVGALLGGLLLYAIILAVTTGLGYAIGSVGGPDAADVGGIVGFLLGVFLIVRGCLRR